MLYHLTMTHTPEDCPAYDAEQMAKFVTEGDKVEALARELGLKIHFLVWGAPEHVAYALIETEDFRLVTKFVFAFPIRQDVKVTTVQYLQGVINTLKEMKAQK
jgi:hypothetical protein